MFTRLSSKLRSFTVTLARRLSRKKVPLSAAFLSYSISMIGFVISILMKYSMDVTLPALSSAVSRMRTSLLLFFFASTVKPMFSLDWQGGVLPSQL